MSPTDATERAVIDQLRGDNAELTRIIEENSRLQAERQYLASIVEFSNDAIISADMLGIVTSWNHAARNMFGYESTEIVGSPIGKLYPPDRRDEERDNRARIKNGEIVAQYETVRVDKHGNERQVSLAASPIVNANGEVIGVSKILRDISVNKKAREELRALQAELVHLSRWNMMGMMASSLAHELNQPLTATLNYIRVARRTLDSTPEALRASDLLEKAIEETKLAGGIIRSLREFIDKRETTRTVEDLATVLEDSLTLSLYVGAEGRDKIQTRFSPGLPAVLIDKVQVQQVVLNLVRNALEAMGNMPDGELIISAMPSGDGFVTVSVSDSGPGLAPEVAGRLFQPFTTTKESGMGVGLSICKSIVEDHGGRIWAEEHYPRGAMFRFTLPLANLAMHGT